MQQVYKPGSVIPQGGISIIYLSDLPPGIGRATLKRRYTWSCNPWVCTAIPVARNTGELLPHPFTFSSANGRGSYFLLHNHTLTGIFLFESMVLCVARTFLLPL